LFCQLLGFGAEGAQLVARWWRRLESGVGGEQRLELGDERVGREPRALAGGQCCVILGGAAQYDDASGGGDGSGSAVVVVVVAGASRGRRHDLHPGRLLVSLVSQAILLDVVIEV
jgi:hypothetical protein